jgi:cardiolipin synthase
VDLIVLPRLRESLCRAGLGLLLAAAAGCASFPGHGVRTRLEPAPPVTDPQFARSLEGVLGMPVVASNRVTSLVDGGQFFPDMLEAIRAARHSITLESYIYWSGEVGSQFTEALAAKAQAGVKVHLLVDWVGSRHLTGRDLDTLRKAGVEARVFNPLSLLHLTRFNHRDHRKILVVDGRVGFIGGAGVADVWQASAESPEPWRDAFFRLEGPAVAQLQAIFAQNWLKVSGRAIAGPEYFPELSPAGDTPTQAFAGDPRSGSDRVRLMYLLAFASAHRSIRLSMAYFVPDNLTLQELVAARERGVSVEIIVPGKDMDSPPVRPASRSRWGKLLKAGARLYEHQASMYHCKVLIVDDAWVSVGSSNLDPRSLQTNDEANLNVFSAGFAAGQIAVFEADKARSREVTWAQWKHRSFWKRLNEWLVTPFTPLL